MKRIIITDIAWDSTEELPSEMTIDVTPENEYLLDDINESADNLSDYLSDQTGYCHLGFCAEVEEVTETGGL